MNRHWSIRAYYFQGEDAREALRDALLGAGEPELRSALLDVYDQIPIDQGYLWRRSEAGQYVSWIRLLRESAPGLLLRMPSRLQTAKRASTATMYRARAHLVTPSATRSLMLRASIFS